MTQAGSKDHFDLAVVGAGIVGLATALAGARRGFKVLVVDKDAEAEGASVRNFGFVTVTGQEAGSMWARARRSREVWREVCKAAAIPVVHTGMWMLARRAESAAVIEAFMATDMAEGCRVLSAAGARRRCPQLNAPGLTAVLESTLELRVESRAAIPALARWLADSFGVHFIRETAVRSIEAPWVYSAGARWRADRIVVCPGDEFSALYADRLAEYGLTRCKLQMLRLSDPGFRLPATLMSDLGMARNAGYAALGAAAALKARLAVDQPEHLKHGVHLIAVQDADGSLIVGDSHQYTPTPDGAMHAAIENLILDEFRAALGFEPPRVIERWMGTYAYATDRAVLVDAPEPAVRLAIVTCGSGASTGFALGEEVVDDLL